MLDYVFEQVDCFANLLDADGQRGKVDPRDNGKLLRHIDLVVHGGILCLQHRYLGG